MKDYVWLGSVPAEEDCVQVGTDNYEELAKAECQRYKQLILKINGTPPPGAKVIVKGQPHDLGTYYEVAVAFDSNSDSAEAYAMACEDATPATWDGAENGDHE